MAYYLGSNAWTHKPNIANYTAIDAPRKTPQKTYEQNTPEKHPKETPERNA